jgi:hypothetical protein
MPPFPSHTRSLANSETLESGEISDTSALSTFKERSNSRITSLMAIPVFAQYCDNFCVSVAVRFTVNRLTAHFLFTIYFLMRPITFVTENYTFVSKPLLIWLLANLIQSISKQLAFLLVLLMGSFTGTYNLGQWLLWVNNG